MTHPLLSYLKKPKKSARQHGFTLIELLLYISIVGGLLTAVVMFFATTVETRVKTQTISEVNQQGTAAMEYITGVIRDASSITSPAAGASAASLTLVVPTGSLSPTVIDLNGSTLQTKEGAAAAVPLTSPLVQISSLSFTNLSRASTPGIIQIRFTVTRTNPNNRNEYDYQKIFTASAALRWP